jgi:hypothetical protein
MKLNLIKNLQIQSLTMYNLNYGGFDYVRIHSELLTSVPNQKLTHINP